MKHSRTETDVACAICGVVNEAHLGRDEHTPKVGDISLCWRCHGLSLFVPNALSHHHRHHSRLKVLMPPPQPQVPIRTIAATIGMVLLTAAVLLLAWEVRRVLTQLNPHSLLLLCDRPRHFNLERVDAKPTGRAPRVER